MSRAARDQALADLARDHGERLVRYAYLFTGDVAAAQDLVQDALVKVFVRTRSGFEPDVLEAYVRRTIATLFVDGHRRRGAFTGRRHLVARPDHLEGPETGAADRVDLHTALATLGRQERTAVVLRYFEDLTVPEVARQMGLADGTVKRYLSNAVRRLEDRLGPIRPPDDVEVVPIDPHTVGRG